MRYGLGLLVAAALCVGCKRDNPRYCESDADCGGAGCDLRARECFGGGPDASLVAECERSADCVAADAPICGVDARCRACAASDECAALDPATAVCADDGRCVGCVLSSDCGVLDAPICADRVCRGCAVDTECAASDAGLPFCGAAGACVECRDHGDCASGACDRAAQTCIAASAIVYVDAAALEDAEGCGGQGDPCRRLASGLREVGRASTKTTIVVAPGDYREDIDIAELAVTIIAPGATLRPSSTERPALRVGQRATVSLDGLALGFAATGTGPNGDGVRCDQAGSSVRLSRVLVRNNDRTGIDVTGGCALVVQDSQVVDNLFRGINFEQGALVVARSRIEGNKRGGLQISEATAFTVVNNFIVGNGTPDVPGVLTGSLIGGVAIDQGGALRGRLAAEPEGSVFAFNTVVRNRARAAADASGVLCDLVGSVTVTGNIVYSNEGGVGPVSGSCAFTYSDIQGGRDGVGNIDADPAFADPTAGDFHLRGGSPCVDAADPAATLGDDFDGDPRPRGARHDIGADERI
jgi:hypothetical protein